MIKFSKVKHGIVLFAAMFALGACGTTQPEVTPDSDKGGDITPTEANGSQLTDAGGEKIVRLNNSTEPGALHPALAEGTHDSWVLYHSFEGLYGKGVDGMPTLQGATSVETSEDGITWTFKLREDAKWSNGDNVTAYDYINSWYYCLDPANAAKYSTQLYIFKGAKEYNSYTDDDEEEAQALKDAVAIRALDEYTLEFDLTDPLSYLPDLLTHYTFLPVNSQNQINYPDWYTSPDHYVSNGPFVLTEWAHKDHILLRKNEYYYDKDKIKLDGVHFVMVEDKATAWQMYQEGQLDLEYSLLPSVIEQLLAEENPELVIADNLASYYYIINVENKPFNNLKVRKALATSIDREIITKHITKGGQYPSYTFSSRGMLIDDETEFVDAVGRMFEEDPAGAKALLEEGLAEEGIALDDFKFSILYNTDEVHKKMAEAIQAMWSENLGINVGLENAEFQVTLDRKASGDFGIARAGWVGDYTDPMTYLEIFTSYSEFNDSNYNNPEYDELIEAAFKELDSQKRIQILIEAERLLMTDLPIIPIYSYTSQTAKKPYLTGVFTPSNRYPTVIYADIEK